MGLYHSPEESESDAKFLATEARKQLTGLAHAAFNAYANCRNYEVNNTKDVTPAAYKKALGSDLKQYESAMRAMKRLMILINPEFKKKIASLIPKPVKPAK
jgi:hypothetical protein